MRRWSPCQRRSFQAGFRPGGRQPSNRNPRKGLAVDARGGAFALVEGEKEDSEPVVETATGSALSGRWRAPARLTLAGYGGYDPQIAVDARGDAVAARETKSPGNGIEAEIRPAGSDRWRGPENRTRRCRMLWRRPSVWSRTDAGARLPDWRRGPMRPNRSRRPATLGPARAGGCRVCHPPLPVSPSTRTATHSSHGSVRAHTSPTPGRPSSQQRGPSGSRRRTSQGRTRFTQSPRSTRTATQSQPGQPPSAWRLRAGRPRHKRGRPR